MTETKRQRVVYVCGGLPVDPVHLEVVGRQVDLTIYHSLWLPKARNPVPAVPGAVEIRSFRPVFKSPGGALHFLYKGMRRALDIDRPDVIHVVSEPWGLLAAQAASWVRSNPGTKLVLHGCDTIWHHGGLVEQRIRRSIIRYTLPRAAAWAAENSKALALASRHQLPERSLLARIHTNPRDSKIFRRPTTAERQAARASLAIPGGTVAIGMIGRLVPEKGVRLLLDATEALLSEGVPLKLLIAGDGPLRADVEKRSNDQIVAMGSLAHPAGVQHLLYALDILACPSLTTPSWEDQGPRSVLEGMMCGCIPLATPTGGLPEMLDGHGVLSASTDTPAVIDAILEAAQLSRRGDLRDDLSEWARETYSAEAVGGQLHTLWSSVHNISGEHACPQ